MTLLLFSPKRVWNYRDKLARNRNIIDHIITAFRLFVRKSFPPHNLANCCSRSKFYLMAALSRLSSQRPSNIQSCRHGDSPYLQTSTCMESLRYIQPKTSLTSAHYSLLNIHYSNEQRIAPETQSKNILRSSWIFDVLSAPCEISKCRSFNFTYSLTDSCAEIQLIVCYQ